MTYISIIIMQNIAKTLRLLHFIKKKKKLYAYCHQNCLSLFCFLGVKDQSIFMYFHLQNKDHKILPIYYYHYLKIKELFTITFDATQSKSISRIRLTMYSWCFFFYSNPLPFLFNFLLSYIVLIFSPSFKKSSAHGSGCPYSLKS